MKDVSAERIAPVFTDCEQNMNYVCSIRSPQLVDLLAVTAHLASLNDDQRRAAAHAADGPLLVIAGAGSGKTNTLAHRVAHLIVEGADPRRILLAHLFPPRGRRDDPPGGADRRPCYRPERRGRGARLVRHLPRHRRAAAARARRRHRPRPVLHHPRPERLRRPDQPRPPRTRLLEDGKALSAQGHLPRHLFAHRQRAGRARRRASQGLSHGAPTGRRSCGRCSPPTSRPSSARTSSTTTTSCSTSPRCSPSLPSAPRPAAASTTCWSTSTRTPTVCRRASSWRSSRPAAASPWSATMPSPSTPSAPRRCATSSTSRKPSGRMRRSSRLPATTARPRRCSPPPTP